MSTRCILGVRTADNTGVRAYGRLVHCDGYPEAVLPELRTIVDRDGCATAMDTLLQHEWHSLHADQNAYSAFPTGIAVAGYGVAVDPADVVVYTDEGVVPFELSEWTASDLVHDRVDAQYGYFLDPSTLTVELVSVYPTVKRKRQPLFGVRR